MAVINREQVGWIQCPMCEVQGTVHESKIGRGGKKPVRYWRCQCGCIQPWAEAGQAFIAQHMVPMDGQREDFTPGPEPEPEKQGEPAPARQPEKGEPNLWNDVLQFFRE